LKVKVRLFGHFADFWPGEREVGIEEGATVSDVAAEVSASEERLAAVSRICRAALNEEYVSGSTRLSDGDTVAFIPPMSGG